jgi:hypothetical protein
MIYSQQPLGGCGTGVKRHKVQLPIGVCVCALGLHVDISHYCADLVTWLGEAACRRTDCA